MSKLSLYPETKSFLPGRCKYTASVIIPTYNEEASIAYTLRRLGFCPDIEVIVSDGQSQDKTLETAKKFPIKIIQGRRNRADQLNRAAYLAGGEIFIFLHADCELETGAPQAAKEAVARGFLGGCFSQRIISRRPVYRLIELSGNIRARVFKTFYGDQAIFVRRDVFFKLGGFDRVEFFDDTLFSKKLNRLGRSCVLKKRVSPGPRRWEKQGVLKTTLINWLLALGLLSGVSPNRLKKMYSDVR